MSSASPVESCLACFRPFLQPASSSDAHIIKAVKAYATCMETYKNLPEEIEKAAVGRRAKLNDQHGSIQLLHGDSYLSIAQQKAQPACDKIKEMIDSLKEIIDNHCPGSFWDSVENHRGILENYQKELTDLRKRIREAAIHCKIETPAIQDQVRTYLTGMFSRTTPGLRVSEKPAEQASDVVVGDKEKEADQ